MKYLVWAVVIYLAWRWYTAYRRASSKPDETVHAGASADADNTAEAMVKCAQCGLHLPYSEALHGPGPVTFCSEDHRAQHHR